MRQNRGQFAEMPIDLLLDGWIEAGIGGQIGNEAVELLSGRRQDRIALAQPMQRVELAAVAHPDFVVGRHCGTPQAGVDLEDTLCKRAKLPNFGEMLRIGVGVLARRRRQVFASIAAFEIAQFRRGALEVLAGARPNQQIVGPLASRIR